MKILIALLALASLNTFAATKMNADAVEMFKVLSHHQVQDCLKDVDMGLVNVEIKKEVARCPGCNTYTITGGELQGDMVKGQLTMKIIGKAVPGTFRGFIQTYRCEVTRN